MFVLWIILFTFFVLQRLELKISSNSIFLVFDTSLVSSTVYTLPTIVVGEQLCFNFVSNLGFSAAAWLSLVALCFREWLGCGGASLGNSFSSSLVCPWASIGR